MMVGRDAAHCYFCRFCGYRDRRAGCVNLVFVKPVYSLIKMQQMMGRGTRSNDACRYFHRLRNGHKDEFLIIDFWENEFDKDPSEETVTQDLPVTVKIFNTRLKLLELY
jgi:type I site-specific restriction endonuclease